VDGIDKQCDDASCMRNAGVKVWETRRPKKAEVLKMIEREKGGGRGGEYKSRIKAEEITKPSDVQFGGGENVTRAIDEEKNKGRIGGRRETETKARIPVVPRGKTRWW